MYLLHLFIKSEQINDLTDGTMNSIRILHVCKVVTNRKVITTQQVSQRNDITTYLLAYVKSSNKRKSAAFFIKIYEL